MIEEEEELEFYDLSALYRLFKSLYSDMYCAYRGKKGEIEIGCRETWNSTTVTMVLLRARSTAPIHGIAILRPHPSDYDEYDGYINEKMNDVGASSGHQIRVFRLRGETCNRSTTAAPLCNKRPTHIQYISLTGHG